MTKLKEIKKPSKGFLSDSQRNAMLSGGRGTTMSTEDMLEFIAEEEAKGNQQHTKQTDVSPER